MTSEVGVTQILWQRCATQVRRIPRRTLGLILVGALCIMAAAFYSHISLGRASLHLKVQHSFRNAELSVWVDDDLVCNAHMSGVVTKKFGLVPTSVRGSFVKTVHVPAGWHQVRATVESRGGANIQTGTTVAVFAAQREKTLQIISGRGSELALAWQDSGGPVTEASTGWFGRYANQILMTISGTLVSALTAYLIKEIPLFKPTESRSDTAEKA